MEERIITEAMLLRYRAYLEEEEKSRNTIEKYMRDLRAFRSWLSDRPVSRQETAAYKERLKEIYTVRSLNSMLSSVNSFFRYWSKNMVTVVAAAIQSEIGSARTITDGFATASRDPRGLSNFCNPSDHYPIAVTFSE